MASISEFNIPAPTLRDWVAQKFHAMQIKRAKRAAYVATFNELNALSNRDLADLGISRSGIRSIAAEAAENI